MVDNNTQGEMGIFPTLTEPAHKIAATLPLGESQLLQEYPSFGVCHKQDFSDQAQNILTFEVGEQGFVLFEVT